MFVVGVVPDGAGVDGARAETSGFGRRRGSGFHGAEPIRAVLAVHAALLDEVVLPANAAEDDDENHEADGDDDEPDEEDDPPDGVGVGRRGAHSVDDDVRTIDELERSWGSGWSSWTLLALVALSALAPG